MDRMEDFIRGIPKTELHMHLEGSLEPELLMRLGERNKCQLRWKTAEELRNAYEFSDLQSFLDLYYEGCQVLVEEADFYELARAYLRKAHAENVVRAEVFLGPQSFTSKGVDIASVLNGTLKAIDDAEQEDGISCGLIVTAQRHRTEQDALDLLEQVRPWFSRILGIGMGGAEKGNPPSKFRHFFRACRREGIRITAHAGEEGPASYVREAVELLGVDRVDHGVSCLDDPALVREMADIKIPLTVCPISNLRLKGVPSLEAHPLKKLMDAGLHVTVNSDDPSYFRGYVSENLVECQRALGLTVEEIVSLVRNGFTAAFISPAERAAALARVDKYVSEFNWSH
ncbi:adenosine deaminase [Reyranella soli]|jgi:adenosine deaminase|uniref:Adenine deaminase n=1 Tax=Reyranella soli TaxID=1230389 RepID=A0A512NDY2_9HYPH|nr:adenosine deaminase [Reyranella soli]GEP57155.1 adenine deaminase [Reyranella soli]